MKNKNGELYFSRVRKKKMHVRKKKMHKKAFVFSANHIFRTKR